MLQSDFFFYLIVILVVVIVVGLMVLIHAGFFYTLRLRMVPPPVLPHYVAYTLRTGAYKNVGPAFRRLSALAPRTKLFGIYYDCSDNVSHFIGASDTHVLRRIYVGTRREAKMHCRVLFARPSGKNW